MILAVDMGNTHIVMGGISSDGSISKVMRMETNMRKTEYEYAADIRPILAFAGIDEREIEGVIISSVVPPLTATLQNALRLITGLDALIVGAGVKTGLNIAIDDPGTIAADLVVTAVAAKNEYALPCIIIDLGTATTVTVVNEKGSYIGGAIMPGVGLSLGALTQGTALLPTGEIAPPQKTIATNTIDSMKSGIIFGSAGALDGILDRYEEVLGKDISIVATGGLATTVCPHCRHEIRIDNDLLMKGLKVIWDRNQTRRH